VRTTVATWTYHWNRKRRRRAADALYATVVVVVVEEPVVRVREVVQLVP
jgi:hypothetical protein